MRGGYVAASRRRSGAGSGSTVNPTIKQQKTRTTAPGSSTISVTLDTPAVAGNALVFASAIDKQPGALTMSGWNVPINLRSASVSLVVVWKVAGGGETLLSGSLGGTAPPEGAGCWGAELEQDGSGAWGQSWASANSNDVTVMQRDTGTTPTLTIPLGLALAFWAIDTVANRGSDYDFLNSFTEVWVSDQAPSPNDGGEAGIFVAKKNTTAGQTVSSTLVRNSGTVDQMSGSILVLGRS